MRAYMYIDAGRLSQSEGLIRMQMPARFYKLGAYMYKYTGTLSQTKGLYVHRCQHAFPNSGPICTQMPVRFHKVPDEIK